MSHGCDCHTTYGPRPKDHVAEAKMHSAMRNAAKLKAFRNFVDHFNASVISQERINLLKLDFLRASEPVRAPHALIFPEIGKVLRQINDSCDFHFSVKGEKIIIRKRDVSESHVEHFSYPIMALKLSLEEKEDGEEKSLYIHVAIDSDYEEKASFDCASL